MCVFYLHLLHSEDQNKFLTNRMRTFFGSEDFLAGPHNFTVLFVQTWLGFTLKLSFDDVLLKEWVKFRKDG